MTAAPPPRTTLDDLLAFADALYGRAQTGEEGRAVARDILAAQQAALAHRRRTGRPHPVFGDGGLAAASRSRRDSCGRPPSFENPDYCRALAIAATAMADNIRATTAPRPEPV